MYSMNCHYLLERHEMEGLEDKVVTTMETNQHV